MTIGQEAYTLSSLFKQNMELGVHTSIQMFLIEVKIITVAATKINICIKVKFEEILAQTENNCT